MDTTFGPPTNPSGQDEPITQHIAHASELFRQDVTMRTLLESLGQGVVIIDTTGHILLVNTRAAQMFGYEPEGLVGKHHDIVIPDRLRSVHDAHMAGYFKEPKIRPMGQGLDLVARRSDGSEFPVEISLSFVSSPGSILIIALVTDITLRVENQRALAQRAQELAESNQALEAFSYSVSHDLKTPLQALIGLGKILQEDFAENLDQEGKDYLERIILTGVRMQELVNNMLALSRVSRHEMVMEDIDLQRMAESIVEELRHSHPDSLTRVTIQPGLKAKGDPRLIRIALTNLIGNAWKYSSKAKNPGIEIGATRRQDHTTYYVRDNGVGFDMKFASRLFSPFQRLHTDAEFAGSGVGLAIAARAISRHNGRIWAESSPGKGAVFFFELE